MDRYSTTSAGVSVNRDAKLEFILMMPFLNGDLDLFSFRPPVKIRRNVATE